MNKPVLKKEVDEQAEVPPVEDVRGGRQASGEGHRRGKGILDLAALFEEVDREAQRSPERSGGEGAFDDLLTITRRPAPAESATSPAPPETGRASPLSIRDARGPAASVDTRVPVQDADSGGWVIPQALQAYLPPDLWRRLNGATPERDELIDALKHVRSILFLISAFLPRHLVQEKMRRPYPGLVKGQIHSGSLMFSDVSGFTALSERLAGFGQEGAEHLTKMMNRYFTAMVDILAESDGILLKFAGDAMLVYFPEQGGGEQAAKAIRAGQRMLRKMSDFAQIETLGGEVNLRMKIGVATGPFLSASVGSAERMEYFVLGQAVTETMAAEGLTTAGGQLVLNAATAASLKCADGLRRLNKGYFLLEGTCQAEPGVGDDYEIQPEARRARGAIPWNASPQAIVAQIEVALRQIQAVAPYLPPELLERLVVQSGKRRITSQYRPTTVMFCNFVGPEMLLNMWGEEGASQVTSLLNAYFNAMQRAVQRYGGIISRVDPYSKGTKMLILFGAPVAHEDDSQRAVSAALAMNAELEALEEAWRRRLARHLPENWNGPLIQHRLGITSGETYAGQVGSATRGEYTVMGDNVNLAARLMGAAEMGHILLGQSVREDVVDYFVLTARPPIRVKGKSKPVATFQVEGPQDDTLSNRARQRGPLIGRQAELAQGERILGQALRGNGAILYLQGPAGIGKSHLADILLNRASDAGATVFSNLCRSYHAETPFACWSNFMRSLAGITSIDDNPQSYNQKFRQLMEDLVLPQRHIPSLAALTGLRRADFVTEPGDGSPDSAFADGDDTVSTLLNLVRGGKVRRKGSDLEMLQRLEQRVPVESGRIWQSIPEQLSPRERDALFSAVGALLESLAKRGPVVIFFEDAQWMDHNSQHLLHYLDQKFAMLPLLCILARRGEEPGSQEHSQGIGQTLELRPLDRAGTAELVAHLFVSDLIETIHEQSLGNPLLIAEIVNWLRRTHRMNADDLRSVLQSSDCIQKLVLSGLENLPEAQREIIRVASVIGSAGSGAEFRTGEVQALLATDMDPVTLSNHLRALMRENLIALVEAGADARYAFQQSLVRDILYNSLPHEQRRELHLKVAEYLTMPLNARRRAQARIAATLEAAPLAGPGQEEETIAYHFEQAENWQKAAQYLLAAAEQAQQHQVYEKAFSLYGRTLEDINRLPGADIGEEAVMFRRAAYLGQGDAALLGGDYLAAVPAYEAAFASIQPGRAPMAGQPADVVWAISRRLALVWPTQGRADEALAILHRIAPSPAETDQAESTAIMTWLLWRSGKAGWKSWMERTRELLGVVSDPWGAGIEALFEELVGEHEFAILDYLALERPVGAAVVSIRIGEQLMASPGSALKYFQNACHILRDRAPEAVGIPLAFYRQAEAYWRMQDVEAAQQALEQGLAELDQGAGSALSASAGRSAMQARCRSAFRRALKLVTSGVSSAGKRWPACDWQPYEDSFRISILFHP